jgi:hypothetical protein
MCVGSEFFPRGIRRKLHQGLFKGMITCTCVLGERSVCRRMV